MADGRCGLTRRFLSLAVRAGDAPALLAPAGGVIATRAGLAQQVLHLADVLGRHVRSGEPTVLSLPNSAGFVAAFLALRSLGAPVALVDATAPEEELLRAADTVGAARLVGGPQRFADARIQHGDDTLAVAGHTPQRRPTLPPGTAVLKLTSGSTGAPRAIAIATRQLAADTVQIMRTMGVGSEDVTLAAIPLTHSYGVGSCLVPLLLAGTPLVLVGVQLPGALASALEATRVCHFPAVPAMIRALVGLGRLPELPDLRVCLSAGAPLSPADAAAFHAVTGQKVHVFYGSSECGGITFDRSDEVVQANGMVGTALERVGVTTLGEDGRPTDVGIPGRVAVASRAVALASLPPPDDVEELRPGRFLTGDTGVLDDQGRLTLTGRLADTLNVAGKKVHPDEVRCVLESAPGVREAVVVGLPDAHRGHLVAALITALPGVELEVPRLLGWCRDRLAPHKIPRRVVIAAELPRTDRGKLDREAVSLALTRRDPPPAQG